MSESEHKVGEYEGSTLQALDNLVHELTGDEGEDDSFTVLRRAWAKFKPLDDFDDEGICKSCGQCIEAHERIYKCP